MTKIDIILPSLNSGKYLVECLESIRLQNAEKTVYLIDGESTDNTFDVLQDFPEVKVSKMPCSVKEAFCYGFVHGDGDYVVCFACDNVMLPGFLESAQKILDGDKEVGLVYGTAPRINDKSEKIAGAFGGPFLLDRLWQNNFIDFSQAVFRRTAWSNDYPEWLYYHLDWYIWLKISKKWKVVDLAVPVVFYRVHGNSNANKMRAGIDAEYHLIKQKMARNELEL